MKTDIRPLSFEDFLQEKHAELFPTVLDDDGPDHFDDWLGSLDGEDYIKYAEEYGERKYNEGIETAAQ